MNISACPTGWERRNDFSKCYYVISDDMNWNDANEKCRDLDPDDVATLSSIVSQAESDYIQSLLGDSVGSWIGGTDEAVEGTWRWGNLWQTICTLIIFVLFFPFVHNYD